jgi:imidazolonepropionase-like amidohydrolase
LEEDQRQSCDLYLVGFGDDEGAAEDVYAGARNALMQLVLDSGLPILAGTDTPAFCGSAGASLALELELLGRSGLTPLEVLRSATLTPARVFGLGARFGALDVGMDADIVVLPSNPLLDVRPYADPVAIFWGGQWRSRSELLRLRTAGTPN